MDLLVVGRISVRVVVRIGGGVRSVGSRVVMIPCSLLYWPKEAGTQISGRMDSGEGERARERP